MARVKQAELLQLESDVDDAVTYEVPVPEKERMTDADLKTLEFLDKAASYGAEASIIIRKQSDDGTDSLDYCERVPVDRFDFWQLHDYIANKYGGGVYRLFVTRKGTRGLLENILITISKKAEKAKEQSGDPVMMRLLENMEKLQARVEQRLGGAAPVDPMEQMMKMMQMMQMMQSLQPKQSPMSDMLGFIKGIKEIGPMIGLGESSDKSDDMPWGQIIGSALPAIVGAMQQPVQARPIPKAKPNPQARPVPPSPQTTGANNVPNMDPAHVAALKPYIQQAIQAASFKVDPYLIAEKICEAIEEQPELEQVLLAPDVIDKIILIEPRAASYKSWFIDVLEWTKGALGHGGKYASEFADDTDAEGETLQPKDDPLDQ